MCFIRKYITIIFALPLTVDCFFPQGDIIIELYTRENREGFLIRYQHSVDLHSSTFNASNPTRYFVHGWTGLIDDRVRGNILLINAYLHKGNFNVFTVNWTNASNRQNYLNARQYVKTIGKYMAEYIDYIIYETKGNANTYTIIGFSLGGHIAGIAAKNVKAGKIGNVISLDPAGPDFYNVSLKNRVAIGDAQYVEVIHTNIDVLGYSKPLGDIDFYPNGGKLQPGCLTIIDMNCSHFRSIQLLAESIIFNNFIARKCDNLEAVRQANCYGEIERKVKMGGEPIISAAAVNGLKRPKGIYYLTTKGFSPFAITV